MQIFKSCILIFFIFISISWLMQITRLFSMLNVIQIKIFNVFMLSVYMIPNLINITLPFIVIFGLVLCFYKLDKDKEIIAIYSSGLGNNNIKNPLISFVICLIILYVSLNTIISPIVYNKYKINEFNLRNTINFEKLLFSNFIQIDNDTIIDFDKETKNFKEIFINIKSEEDNLIYADSGIISSNTDEHLFKLINGFKLSLIDDEIEKLEFKNYTVKVPINDQIKYDNVDKNTFTIFQDFKNKNYENIFIKISDTIILLIVINFFYFNNIKKNNFSLSNNLKYILISIIFLIIYQIIKNSSLVTNYLIILVLSIVTFFYLLTVIEKYFSEQN